jgi:hypothetical protein
MQQSYDTTNGARFNDAMAADARSTRWNGPGAAIHDDQHAAGAPRPDTDRRASRHPETRRALRRYWACAVGIELIGLAGVSGLGALVQHSHYLQRDNNIGSDALALVGIALFGLMALGLLMLVWTWRLWMWLRQWPWRSWQCRYRPAGEGRDASPCIVLTRPGRDDEYPLFVSAFRESQVCVDGEVWLAGDPARRGVLSRPGGGRHLNWTSRLRSTDRERATRRGDAAAP